MVVVEQLGVCVADNAAADARDLEELYIIAGVAVDLEDRKKAAAR